MEFLAPPRVGASPYRIETWSGVASTALVLLVTMTMLCRRLLDRLFVRTVRRNVPLGRAGRAEADDHCVLRVPEVATFYGCRPGGRLVGYGPLCWPFMMLIVVYQQAVWGHCIKSLFIFSLRSASMATMGTGRSHVN